MSRLPSRVPSRYESIDDPTSPHTKIKSRSFFAGPLVQGPVLTNVGSVLDWDGPQSAVSGGQAVSESMWNAIRQGVNIGDLINASPEEVMHALRDHAVKRLGTFRIKDTEVLLAFDKSTMLTRGSETVRDTNFVANWKAIIKAEIADEHKHARKRVEGGWEEDVTIAAYVVNIKDAAAGFGDGLLSPLIAKSQSGAASNEVWDFPAVQAIIEFKWRHWARRYLLFEFGLYLGWVISFSIFLITNIEWDLDRDFMDEGAQGRFWKTNAGFFDTLAVLFMLPFLAIEYNTICFYRIKWLQMWNVIDSLAYFLQLIITYGHLIRKQTDSNFYSTILAVQCILLFIKVQYFARVFGAGTSFIELLVSVMLKVRWFLVFIGLSMISVALAFAMLFKHDASKDVDEGEENPAEDFANVVRSLVTTYAILLGDFNPDYVFEGTNRVVKGIFFLGFQVLMSITLLNLLIAVMTESYAAVTTDSRIMYNVGRAQVMEELEVALPASWGPSLKPYCHFIVVEKEKRMQTFLSGALPSAGPSLQLPEASQTDIQQLKTTVEEMKTTLDNLAARFPE